MAVDSERDSLLRILVATDNHLGVWEKDPIRENDSFASFEEVFQIARDQNADLVLLGGDLFHDNKPSRTTLVKAMDILARHCMSDRPISFQLLSDQADVFVNGRANFKNPDYNIGLPVFTIHGNHDDPSGSNNLSAVDVLSTCNLVNYFGKTAMGGSGMGKVYIKPILLQKGDTKVALYGLGNIRDERLGRMFQTPGCIEWAKPADDTEYPANEWTSLLVLHQNRYGHAQSARNFIKDSYLPSFLDLVVWGHEHECIRNTTEAANGISIIQPGSSVATALSEGESKKKHVVVLEILKESYRTVFEELRSVRPFKFDQVVLAEKKELDCDDAEVIEQFLVEKVESMVQECQRQQQGAKAGRGTPPPLPLVRLRVDYSGFGTIHSQRFGQKFVGKVANPNDVLHWFKPKAKARKAEEKQEVAAAAAHPDEHQIEDLVAENLQENLLILPEVDLAAALHDYVDKDEKGALLDCVSNALAATQTAAAPEKDAGIEEEEVTQLLNKHAERRKVAAKEAAALRAQEQAVLPKPSLELSKPGTKRPPKAPTRNESISEDEDALGDEEEEEPPLRKAPPARGRGRGASRGRSASQPSAAGRAAKRQKTLDGLFTSQRGTQSSAASGSKTPGRQKSSRAASAKARQTLVVLDDEDGLSGSDAEAELDLEEVEDSEDEGSEETAAKPRARQAKRATGRGAAGSARQKAAPNTAATPEPDAPLVISDDDDDATLQPSTLSRGKRRLPPTLFGNSTAGSQGGRFQKRKR